MRIGFWITSVCCAASLAMTATVSAYKVDRETGTVTIASLTDFDACQRDVGYGDACLDALSALVDKQPKLAFAAGKRARLQFNHWVALRFFSKAFVKGSNAAQCADADVAMAVISGLSLDPDDPNVPLARTITTAQCWPQLQPAVSAELEQGGVFYRANACPLLAEKKLAPAACQPVRPGAAPAPPMAAASRATSALEGVQWQELALDPGSARVLRGSRGEEVWMVRAKPSARGLVLLKWKAVQGPWNGQVLITLERNSGRGKDYVALVGGAESVAVTLRDERYEAYPLGQNEAIQLYEVALDRGMKRRPSPPDVLKEFASDASRASPKR